jgi:hypothetical protein
MWTDISYTFILLISEEETEKATEGCKKLFCGELHVMHLSPNNT